MRTPSPETTTARPTAFETFGAQRQLLALAEELAEASAAVSRYLNQKGGPERVVEEIVDVESVVASLRGFLAPPERWALVRQIKEAKLAEVLAREHAAPTEVLL